MIQQLNQRERMVVALGGCALFLVLAYFLIFMPFRNALNRLDHQILSRSQQLHEVKDLQSQYLSLLDHIRQQEERLQHRQTSSAVTVIENLIERVAGRERLVSMRPQSPVIQGDFIVDSIEIKLEKLELGQILELLYEVEGILPPMQVKALHLKQRFDNRSQLDASMTIKSLRRAT